MTRSRRLSDHATKIITNGRIIYKARRSESKKLMSQSTEVHSYSETSDSELSNEEIYLVSYLLAPFNRIFFLLTLVGMLTMREKGIH